MANGVPKSFTLAFLLLQLALLVVGQGTQFITGPCTSDADCADGCCGFNTGKCAGPVIAQEIDGGCGFGNAEPNDNAAVALGFQAPASSATTTTTATAAAAAPQAPASSATTTTTASTSAGTQFITGPCTSDADCASGCCGFNTGKCAGPVFAQEVDGGCGFGNAEPNDNAAVALGFGQNKRAMSYRA